MASNIPTRRVTRTTRAATLRDNENANARPLRVTTRSKPVASTTATASTTNVASGPTRATAATAASRAKIGGNSDINVEPPAGKRKREALGEVTGLVTNNNRVKNTSSVKGKDKEVGNKEKPDGTKVKTISTRQPLRTVAGTRKTSRVVSRDDVAEQVKQEAIVAQVHDDNAMVVDPPAQVHVLKQPTARSSFIPAEGAKGTRGESDVHHYTSLPVSTVPKEADENAEDDRVFKKRRTSSDAPAEDEGPDAPQETRFNADLEARFAAELQACVAEPEADPEGSQWDDLDSDDIDDPLMVSEYVVDIFNYMKQLEQTTMPNPNYMENQKDLAWKMRGILTDWLIQVHFRFRLLPETLFLCVNIIDRFLSARVVSLAKLQLVGVTCMFIAAKFEEVIAPSVTHFLQCADSSYTESEILQAERYVLKTLDWNLSYPNPVHYLRRVSKADDYNVKVRTLAKYLLEIGCLEWRLIAAPPSLMAAAAIWLARLALGQQNWTPNLAHYSSYPESALLPTANLMLNYILKPVRHESFYKKYAAKRYFKSSIHMRQWALDQWPEGTQVDLVSELPRLKVEIRLQIRKEETETWQRETLTQAEKPAMTAKQAATDLSRHREILRPSK